MSSPFFRFPRIARFCDSDGRCRLVRWCQVAARWLKNGVITYLSHGQVNKVSGRLDGAVVW